jgi:uncharacterized protein YdhG (YjbR/CyaY superfamily)
MKTKPVTTVDEYIAAFPKQVQQLLQQMRQCIKKAAPKAEESLSYGMPAYKHLGKPLVYFAGYEKHIGFYATPNGHEQFKKELAIYKQGKGSVQFPIGEALPLALVTKIVQFRVKENEAKTAAKPLKPLKPLEPLKPSSSDPVSAYMAQLSHPLKAEAELLRTIIKKADKNLSERIKWNAPSYHIDKTDLLTFNFGDKKIIRLIFHHPAIVKIKSAILEGEYKDRRIVYIKNAAAVKSSKKEVQDIIKQLVAIINK